MTNSGIIDVVIGLLFVYLTASIFVTAVNELIQSVIRSRAKWLVVGVRALIGEASAGAGGAQISIANIFSHPLLRGYCEDGANPSYVPSSAFASVIIDLLAGTGTKLPDFDSLHGAVDKLPDSKVKRSLQVLLREAENDLRADRTALAKFEDQIEGWFNDGMARVSGWYKRRLQWVLFVLALVIVALLNLDTISIVGTLEHDPVLRSGLVEQAKTLKPPPIQTGNSSPDEKQAKADYDAAMGRIEHLGIPLGWSFRPKDNPSDRSDPRYFPDGPTAWVIKILGLLFTAIAASLGAPFWFDVLNKFMNVRATGKAPDEAPKAPKELPPALPPAATPPAGGDAATG